MLGVEALIVLARVPLRTVDGGTGRTSASADDDTRMDEGNVELALVVTVLDTVGTADETNTEAVVDANCDEMDAWRRNI